MIAYTTANQWFNGKEFWVGAKLEGGSFLWQAGPLDGDEVAEELWANDEPKGPSNQQCVVADDGSGDDAERGLDNINCKSNKYALCEGSSAFDY